VRLTSDQIASVRSILEQIDEGKAAPQIPGTVGRFFRQYSSGQSLIDLVCSAEGYNRRKDGSILETKSIAIHVDPIDQPKTYQRPFPFGEVAEALVLSEELGGLLNLVMWLKGPIARAANKLLKTGSITLRDDYRWHPLGRVTPGESVVTREARSCEWWDARCLKSTCDDVSRPPHALEYAFDSRFGQSSLRFLRCVVAQRQGPEWVTLGLNPKNAQAPRLPATHAPHSTDNDLAALLICREPWSPVWVIAAQQSINPDQAFRHVCSWYDYQQELRGAKTDIVTLRAIHRRFAEDGFRVSRYALPSLDRRLTPIARALHASLRGLA
jgi:hypothetical protein